MPAMTPNSGASRIARGLRKRVACGCVGVIIGAKHGGALGRARMGILTRARVQAGVNEAATLVVWVDAH